MDSTKIRLPPNVSIEKVPQEEDASSSTSSLTDSSVKSSKNKVSDNYFDYKYSEDQNIYSMKEIISVIDISLDKLKVIGTRDLNLLIKKFNVSKERAMKIKDIRRKLKNRSYASCSRERSINEKEKMEKDIKYMNEKRKKIGDQINKYKFSIDGLIKECGQLFRAYENAEELKAWILKECSFPDKETENKFLNRISS